MSVLVSYPNDWIGVPEFGVGEVFATPDKWSRALTDELIGVTGQPLTLEAKKALIDTLRFVGSDVGERGAQSCYVYLETLNGPVHIVDVRLVPRGEVGDATAADVAGATEPDAFRQPTVTDIVTESGLSGVLCVRHAPLDEDAEHVVTLRASYAFEIEGGFFLMWTATTDLTGFERFRPRFAELAASVSVVDHG